MQAYEFYCLRNDIYQLEKDIRYVIETLHVANERILELLDPVHGVNTRSIAANVAQSHIRILLLVDILDTIVEMI